MPYIPYKHNWKQIQKECHEPGINQGSEDDVGASPNIPGPSPRGKGQTKKDCDFLRKILKGPYERRTRCMVTGKVMNNAKIHKALKGLIRAL